MVQNLIDNDRRRRDRLYILAEILEIAMNGALKTQVMYKGNLSFTQANAYLNLLLDVNLLEADGSTGKMVYKTTRKGTYYLHCYREIRELLRKKQACTIKNGNPTVFLVKRGSSVICREDLV